jgi:hypothetical protein
MPENVLRPMYRPAACVACTDPFQPRLGLFLIVLSSHFYEDPHNICQNERCKADLREVKSPTAGLRFHDLRHHAVTELAESQASDQTIMAIAGHVSPKMLAHYSHVRIESKRKALDALSPTTNGYGANSDTNVERAAMSYPQIIEMNGRPVGTRTPNLVRVKEAPPQLSH